MSANFFLLSLTVSKETFISELKSMALDRLRTILPSPPSNILDLCFNFKGKVLSNNRPLDFYVKESSAKIFIVLGLKGGSKSRRKAQEEMDKTEEEEKERIQSEEEKTMVEQLLEQNKKLTEQLELMLKKQQEMDQEMATLKIGNIISSSEIRRSETNAPIASPFKDYFSSPKMEEKKSIFLEEKSSRHVKSRKPVKLSNIQPYDGRSEFRQWLKKFNVKMTQ